MHCITLDIRVFIPLKTGGKVEDKEKKGVQNRQKISAKSSKESKNVKHVLY